MTRIATKGSKVDLTLLSYLAVVNLSLIFFPEREHKIDLFLWHGEQVYSMSDVSVEAYSLYEERSQNVVISATPGLSKTPALGHFAILRSPNSFDS